MFVTSDIYDLAEVARRRRENWVWSEQLVGGLALHGAAWPGHEAALSGFERAIDAAGIAAGLTYANYRLSGEDRSRSVKPASLAKLVAKHGERIRFLECHGSLEAKGACNGTVAVSCSVSSPLDNGMLCVLVAPDLTGAKARLLLTELGDAFGADYGYAFVRDDFAGPETYALGMGVGLDYSKLAEAELDESGVWAKIFLSEAWREHRFPMRDVYEANLLTAGQLDRDLGNGRTLRSWIADDRGRGVLVPAGDRHFMWLLTESEMLAIRPGLVRMGVTISSLPRIYRGLGQTPGIVFSATSYSASHH